MTILRDFGKSDNDQGQWFPFDDECELRIRRVPYDVAQRISKRYGRETFTISDGVKRPQIERTLDEQTQWLLDQAVWAWTDAKGLEVEVGDEEGAKLWSGLTKQDVKAGDAIPLSGAFLTAEVKRRILTQLRPYAQMTDPETAKKDRVDIGTFIVLKASLLQTQAQATAEEARGNS
jgi:hypothetical protein